MAVSRLRNQSPARIVRPHIAQVVLQVGVCQQPPQLTVWHAFRRGSTCHVPHLGWHVRGASSTRAPPAALPPTGRGFRMQIRHPGTSPRTRWEGARPVRGDPGLVRVQDCLVAGVAKAREASALPRGLRAPTGEDAEGVAAGGPVRHRPKMGIRQP